VKVAVQLLRSFDRRSAIGRDVLEIDRVLRDAGFDTHIVCARSTDPSATEPIGAFRTLVDARTLVLYQHAIGWPAGVRLFRRSPGINCLRYQNVTPWRHFLRYDYGYVAATWLGAVQTRRLARIRRVACFLPNSEFTARDLGSDARSRCAIVAPLDGVDPVAPDPATYRGLSDRTINLLSVGRLLPHKGVHHLIRALAVWKGRFPEPVRLCVVGAAVPRLARYTRELHALADTLGVSDAIHWAGVVSAGQLEAYYAAAAVLCVASHHEGFCVPIVEAMRRDVPVVAVATAGVPETAGGGALLLADHDAEALAVAARRAACEPALRDRLLRDARVQLRERHDPAVQRRNLRAVIEGLRH
jgi:glycosyltransferase involved in cell wall biosynthesis